MSLASLFVRPAFLRGQRLGDDWKEWIERNIRVPIRRARVRLDASDDATERYLRESFCDQPFRMIETTPSGLAYACCSAWLPTPIGDINSGVDKAWFGKRAADVRGSILDGSFRYCSRANCSPIANRTLMRRDSAQAKALIAAFESASPPLPKEVVLSHDRSCNLSCPSCRTQTIVADKARQAKLDDAVERLLIPLLGDAEQLMVTGSGDPFGSRHFRRLLERLGHENLPKLRIALSTNGQLLDARAWTELRLSERVREIRISIDAARADTYAIVRRGGAFDRLLRNLDFVKGLRDSGEIEALSFSMVVQQANFREMPDFVRLGERYSADFVAFEMIRNWGTFSSEEFKRHYIASRAHPEFEELLAVLADPRLRAPYARLGNVLLHVERAKGSAA